MARVGQLVAHSLREGYVSRGQRLVCLLGDGFPDSTDLIKVCSVTGEENVTDIFFNKTLTATVELSIELALARVNGEPIGVAFMIGDVESVLMHSYSLMPDPFPGSHANIKDKKQWELVKKYAASFDGAFVIDSDGTIVAAQRHLIANRRCDIPPGLGTRHHAVAAMTAVTAAKGVTVSQEDGFVRVFEKGRVVAKVNPASHVVECFKDSQ
jgi:DNA integrity scanning protein DisA with diadenylate cyclase activity